MSCLTRRYIGMSQNGHASMAMDGVWIEINENKMQAGALVKPEQKLTFVADLGYIYGSKVRFTLRDDASGASWIGPTEVPSFFKLSGGWAILEVTLPFTEAYVTLVATEIRPALPDATMTFPFRISLSAPEPPKKKEPFNWIPWAIAGGALIGLVALAPTINRGIGAVLPKGRG